MNRSTDGGWRQAQIGPVPVWLIALALFALLLRAYGLDWKPPHFDEGINGHFVHEMWHDGFYRYDPTNFHGPLYFYYLQLVQLLFGDGIVAARFGNGLLSVAVVVLVAWHRRFIGPAAIWAAGLIAISAGFVFYSRYSIHESLFILLQALFTYGYFLWREERSRRAFAFMSTAVFMSFATKETFFIFFVTWMIAIWMERCLASILPERASMHPSRISMLPADREPRDQSTKVAKDDLWSILIVVAMVTVMLFTGFFMNDRGFIDMFRAYAFWTKTGVTGTGHEKPFFYWIKLLYSYEWPMLIGLVLTPWVFLRGGRTERVWALAAFGTWLAYSLIPYKTPWCVLDILWPLAVVMGFVLVRGPKKIFVPLLLVAIAVSTADMLRVNFRSFASPAEPYVYVQSTEEFKAGMDLIAAERARAPQTLNMRIVVLSRDTWPMPWLLQDFPHLEYGKVASTDFKNADVILVDATDRAALEPRLSGKYWVEPFHIRDSYEKGFAFYNHALFKGLVPETSAVFDSGGGK